METKIRDVNEDFMTLDEAAEATGIPRSTLNRMRLSGVMKEYRRPLLPNRILLSREEVALLNMPVPSKMGEKR